MKAKVCRDGLGSGSRSNAVSVPALAKQAGSGLDSELAGSGAPSGLNDAGKALGMDADALRELRLEGKSLAEIAEENGITKQSLVEKLVASKV